MSAYERTLELRHLFNSVWWGFSKHIILHWSSYLWLLRAVFQSSGAPQRGPRPGRSGSCTGCSRSRGPWAAWWSSGYSCWGLCLWWSSPCCTDAAAAPRDRRRGGGIRRRVGWSRRFDGRLAQMYLVHFFRFYFIFYEVMGPIYLLFFFLHFCICAGWHYKESGTRLWWSLVII